jgi:hypothetical protein
MMVARSANRGLPAELRSDAVGRRDQDRGVSGTARPDAHGDVDARHAARRLDDLAHRMALAVAEIVPAALRPREIEGADSPWPCCQVVEDDDLVAAVEEAQDDVAADIPGAAVTRIRSYIRHPVAAFGQW